MDEKTDQKTSRRNFLKSGAAVAGLSLLGGAAPSILKAAAPEVIRYGTMHPLTGTYSALGADQMHATQLAVEEWNAKGGVLGHKIEWIYRDDQLNGAVALRRAKELVGKISATSLAELSPAPFLLPSMNSQARTRSST